MSRCSSIRSSIHHSHWGSAGSRVWAVERSFLQLWSVLRLGFIVGEGWALPWAGHRRASKRQQATSKITWSKFDLPNLNIIFTWSELILTKPYFAALPPLLCLARLKQRTVPKRGEDEIPWATRRKDRRGWDRCSLFNGCALWMGEGSELGVQCTARASVFWGGDESFDILPGPLWRVVCHDNQIGYYYIRNFVVAVLHGL